MSFIDDIFKWVQTALAPYTHIPESTFFILGVAVALGLTTSTVSRLLVNYDMVRNSMREFQEWRRSVEKARKANDTQTLSKLMKKQQAMTKLQARASMENLKVTAVTFVPFLLLWSLLSSVFSKSIVAISPFPLPLTGTQLGFVAWYFLSSFAMNLPIMKLFGIGMSDT